MAAEGGEQVAAHAVAIGAQVRTGRRARLPFVIRHQHVEHARGRIHAHHVAAAHAPDRASVQRLGADMDGCRYLARRARHAPVGYQRHMEAAVLQHRQRGRELVQLGHAARGRALPRQHRNEVSLQLAALECVQHIVLMLEHDRRCLHHLVLGLDRRGLDHRAAQPAVQHLDAAVRRKGRVGATHDAVIERRGRAVDPRQLAVAQHGFARVVLQPAADDGGHVVMHQAQRQQPADHHGQPAGGLELVHVGLAVRVHAGQQRHHGRELVKVVPAQHDAGHARHRDQVQRVVGGAAGGQQPDDAVDEGALVQHLGHRRIALAAVHQLQRLARGLARERLCDFRMGAGPVVRGTKAAPGRCRPIISISIWLELAVP